MDPHNDASSKTEPPTPRKLLRARQQGQVARSRDGVHVACLLAALCSAALGTGWVAQQVLGLFDSLWTAVAQPAGPAARALGTQAWQTGLMLCAGALWPLALAGLLADRLQTGPVWSLHRLKPRLEHLDPLAGLRRLASAERWIEVLRSLLKALAAIFIAGAAVKALMGSLSQLPWQGRPQDLGSALWHVGWRVAGGTLAVMAVLAVLEWLDQHRRLMKRLRMSRHELRREHREQEGDPQVKAHRRQVQQASSRGEAAQAARQAHVLLVNPTHVAVAIEYDRRACPVPTVSAKGVDSLALAMRESAEAAGVPIVCNVPLARELHERAEAGDLVPPDLFDVMAEVILWARELRAASGLTSPDDGVARSGGVADAAAGR